MPALLPDALESSTLQGLLPGERCWTLPWAMSVDEEGYCYLNSNYPRGNFSEGPHGTMCMIVEKDMAGRIIVDLTHSYRQKYSKKPNSGPPWFSIPVDEIIFNE